MVMKALSGKGVGSLGMQKATSWSDAKAKAKSCVIAMCSGMTNLQRTFTFVIPKDQFNVNSYFTTGYYASSSNSAAVGFNPYAEAWFAIYNGTDITSSFTKEYYYDA